MATHERLTALADASSGQEATPYLEGRIVCAVNDLTRDRHRHLLGWRWGGLLGAGVRAVFPCLGLSPRLRAGGARGGSVFGLGAGGGPGAGRAHGLHSTTNVRVSQALI